MKNKKVVLMLVCAVVFAAIGALTVSSHNGVAGKRPSQQEQEGGNNLVNNSSPPPAITLPPVYKPVDATETELAPPAPSGPIPDDMVYHHLFSHIVILVGQAEEAEARGEDGSVYRGLYQRLAGLTDDQASMLESIALGCEQLVKRQDETAQKIIDQRRAQESSLSSADLLPPPPPELDTLWQERRSIILEARDNLRNSFGDSSFEAFDQFVRSGMGVDSSGQALPQQ